jgi:hypothetical protein
MSKCPHHYKELVNEINDKNAITWTIGRIKIYKVWEYVKITHLITLAIYQHIYMIDYHNYFPNLTYTIIKIN